mgnify:CR=1 FL=1
MIQWNERRGKDKEGMAEQNQNQDMQKPHKRRVRYKGTHPRTFEEKYKEREPEKYAETIEKVISKGSTPAGMHLSICVDEILEFLQIQPGQRGLDATLGYGGHSRRMLEKLEGSGHLYGLDVDPIEIVKTTARLRENGFGEEILTVRQMNFAEIDLLSEEVGKFDFVLHSIGMSPNVRKGRTYDDLDYDYYHKTVDISAISFHKVIQTCRKFDAIEEWGSVVALTYIAAQRTLYGYNDMADAKAMLESIARSFGYIYGREKNIRINTVSQSPTPTTAGSGVMGLENLMDFAERMSPLGNATAAECADYIITLFSDLTRKVTMQNLYHDGGYSSMGMSMQAMHIYNEGLEYRDVKNDKSRRRNK